MDNDALISDLKALINESRHATYWGGAGLVIKAEDLIAIIEKHDPQQRATGETS